MKKKLFILLLIFIPCLFFMTACGEKVKFDLRFIVDNEVYSTISTGGNEVISMPDNPEKDGYEFDGWYWDNNIWNRPFTVNSLLDTPLSSNMKIYSKWNAIEYTAYFYADNQLVGSSKFTLDDTSIKNIPNVPEKVGYDGRWENYSILANDLTINAVYTPETYNVFYDENGGDEINDDTYTYGIGISQLPTSNTIKRTGYIFKGWETQSGEIVNSISNTLYGDIYLTARWEAIEFTAYFYVDSELLGTAKFTLEDTAISNCPNLPERIGYDGKWEYTIKAENIVVNAIYTIKILTVSWNNYDGSLIKTTNVEYNRIPSYSGNNPTRDSDERYSYSFVGWTPEISNIIVNTTYTAVYSKNELSKFVIKYDANGGTGAPSSQIKEKGKTLTLSSSIPTKDGHRFAGWNNIFENKVYQNGSSYSTDLSVTFYAMWEDYCGHCHGEGTIHSEVTCSSCSGKGTITTTSTSTCSTCGGYGTITTSGSTCAACSGSGKMASVCSTCKGWGGDCLCKCVCGYQWWANQTNSRICASCGRSVIATRYTTCSSCSGTGTVKVKCTICSGTGRVGSTTRTCSSCSGTGRKTTTTTTTCSSCSGTGKRTQTSTCSYCNGQKIIKPTAPSYSQINDRSIILRQLSGYEYSLDGNAWQDSNIFDNLKPSTQYTFYQRVATANGKPFGITSAPLTINTKSTTLFYVSYNLDGGVNNSLNPTQYYSNQSNIQLVNPTKKHYDFAGWKYNNTLVTEIKSSWATDIELTATWVLHNYQINYVLNGGTATNQTTYTIQSNNIVLNKATRKGYTFIGWTGSNGNIPQKNVAIPTGSSGDLEFIANWEANDYTITFETNGGSEISPITQKCDTKLQIPIPTLYGKSFDGWYDITLTNLVNLDKMPPEDITVYAKWKEYDIVVDCNELTAISINDTLSPTLFNAIALDTDNNELDIQLQIIGGKQEIGNTVSVRLIANGLYDVYTTKVISNIKVYGSPTISYNNEKDYINISDEINALLFDATATDTFGSSLEVTVNVKENNYQSGDIITIVLAAKDITNNITTIEIPNIKVYGGAIITRDTSIIEMKEIDDITNAFFDVSAVDYFGNDLMVTTEIYSGIKQGGNIITVKSFATDSKGNTSYVTYDIKVYGLPTIEMSDATILNYKVEDNITLSSLGVVVKDSFGKIITNPILKLTDGSQEAGNVLTYNVTATDHLGNVATKDFNNIKIFGIPSISYNTLKDSIKITDTINASLFSATALDSFNNTLSVNVTLANGELKGGNKVKFIISTTDIVGNIFEVLTNEIKVYSSDNISLTYTTTSSNIKLSSKGEEFNASATNGFGEECEISIIPANGFVLSGGNTINLYLVATDKLGNTKRSELISNINIYDIPILTYARDYDYIQDCDSPYVLFTVKDSFNKYLLFDIEILEGSLDINKTITYKITAVDKVGNNLEQGYTLSVLATDESEIQLYKNDVLIETRRIYKGQSYSLPKEENCNVIWYLDDTTLTNNQGESLSEWNYESGGYKLSTYYQTVTFNANNGVCDKETQIVNYGAVYTLPTPTRVGYTFDGWFNGNTSYNGGNWPIKQDITLTAKWIANNNITYQVKHYQQNVNDDTYSLFETDNLTGTSDFTITPAVKNYSGFTSPSTKTSTILPDGSRIVEYYYTRNSYTLTIIKNDGNQTTASLKYEANLLEKLSIARNNFSVGGYFSDINLSNEIKNMPSQNTTVYVWWQEEVKPLYLTYTGSSSITISAYSGSFTKLQIPKYIGNKLVTTISASAFANNSSNRDNCSKQCNKYWRRSI